MATADHHTAQPQEVSAKDGVRFLTHKLNDGAEFFQVKRRRVERRVDRLAGRQSCEPKFDRGWEGVGKGVELRAANGVRGKTGGEGEEKKSRRKRRMKRRAG